MNNEELLKDVLQRVCGIHDSKNGELCYAIADAKELLLRLYPEQPAIVFPVEEVWGKNSEFPDYEISTYGRVRRLTNNKRNNYKAGSILKGKYRENGYLDYALVTDGKYRYMLAHRLVAMTFIANNNPARKLVAHLDGKPQNNFVGNLKWVSNSENMVHKRFHSKGETLSLCTLSSEQVADARGKYSEGMSCADIARDLDAPYRAVNKAINYTSYYGVQS